MKNPRGLLCVIPHKIWSFKWMLWFWRNLCSIYFCSFPVTLFMYFQQQLTPRIFVADFRNGLGWDHWSSLFQPSSSSWGLWIRDPDSPVSSTGVKLSLAKGSWILSWVPVACVSTQYSFGGELEPRLLAGFMLHVIQNPNTRTSSESKYKNLRGPGLCLAQ